MRLGLVDGKDEFKFFDKYGNHHNVVGLWGISGNWDAICHLRADNMASISEIRETIAENEGIEKIETEVVLVSSQWSERE